MWEKFGPMRPRASSGEEELRERGLHVLSTLGTGDTRLTFWANQRDRDG